MIVRVSTRVFGLDPAARAAMETAAMASLRASLGAAARVSRVHASVTRGATTRGEQWRVVVEATCSDGAFVRGEGAARRLHVAIDEAAVALWAVLRGVDQTRAA